MTTVQTAIDIRSMTADDVPAVLDLLRSSLAGGPTGERSRRFFEWKHIENPFGGSLALVAQANGEIVGLRTLMRWRFKLGERRIEAVRAVDTATHPNFQGRGIFRELTMNALDLATAEAIELVFNTPNDQSLPGYLKMGWSTVAVVPIAIRPIRLLRFARLVRTARRGAPAGPPPRLTLPSVAEVLDRHRAGVEDLLARTPASDRITTDRSIDYLRWRYAEAPQLGYGAVPVTDGGQLVALGIGRPRMRGQLREFTLSEVLTGDGGAEQARRVLRAAAKLDCDHVAAHLPPGTRAEQAGWGAGYLRSPFTGMTLVARPLVPELEPVMRLENWRLSLGDLEVF